MSENSKVNFLQNGLHESNFQLVMLKSKSDIQFLKSATSSNMFKDKCKTKDSKFAFGSFALYLPFSKILLAI